MEATALRKAWVYSALAIVLGLLLVLFPLITLTSIRAEDHHELNAMLSEKLKELDGSSSDRKSSSSDVETLALSVIIALAAFMFLRRRRPQVGRRVIGQLPY
jgi:hypothetical protein